MYFQVTMLVNIGIEYFVLLLVIQKNKKDEKTNLAKAILKILKHFEFMEGNKKANITQITTPSIYQTLKGSCTNK